MLQIKNIFKISTTIATILSSIILISCATTEDIPTKGHITFNAVDQSKGEITFNPTTSMLRDDQISEGTIMASTFSLKNDPKINSGQILSIELLWMPKPGKTAIEETATNITIQWLILSNESWGLYAGGGYAWPNGSIKDGFLELTIKNATLELLKSSSDFVDKLGSINASGIIKGNLDLNTPNYLEQLIETRKRIK